MREAERRSSASLVWKTDVDLVLVRRSAEELPEWIEMNWEGLDDIPGRRVVLETSKPLGVARMRSVQRVRTPYFLCFDDDVMIDEGWYVRMMEKWREVEELPLLWQRSEKVLRGRPLGALQCMRRIVGLGSAFDDALNDYIMKNDTHDLKFGDRGGPDCTLFLTEAIKGWKPSRPDLSAYEDYEMTQYVLQKGYRWVVLSPREIEVYHICDWNKVARNAMWGAEGWKKTHDSTPFSLLREIISVALHPFIVLLSEKSLHLFTFMLVQDFFRVMGLVFR